MSSDNRLSEIDVSNPKYLLVSSQEGATSVVPLTVGTSVSVGAGTNCQIQETAQPAGQAHCVFLLEENSVLKIQDSNTGTTFLNDAPVVDELQVKSGDVVTVGNCRVTAVLDAGFHQAVAIDLLNGEGFEVAQVNNHLAPGDTSNFDSSDHPDRTDDQTADTGFKYDFDADLKENSDTVPAFDSLPIDIGFGFDSVGDGTGSVPIEVEQLRFEIIDRDSQIAALRQELAAAGQVSTVDESDTLKLVSRLEDLLDELEISDERVQSLEELLRAADQATVAEREERSQIDKWLTEIEKRVGQREAEAQAEIEGLARQLQIAKQDAIELQTQLKSISAANQNSDKQSEALTVLNKQIEVLRSNLKETNEKNRELLKRPVMPDDQIDLQAKLLETNDELAQVRLQASKERADMARRHAEIESNRDELEMRLQQPTREMKKGDSRIRAMREHLKEIHAQEQAAKAEQKPNSLGGRISNLLTRLR